MDNEPCSRYSRIINYFFRALPYFSLVGLKELEETKGKYYDSDLVFVCRDPEKLIKQ